MYKDFYPELMPGNHQYPATIKLGRESFTRGRTGELLLSATGVTTQPLLVAHLANSV